MMRLSALRSTVMFEASDGKNSQSVVLVTMPLCAGTTRSTHEAWRPVTLLLETKSGAPELETGASTACHRLLLPIFKITMQ